MYVIKVERVSRHEEQVGLLPFARSTRVVEEVEELYVQRVDELDLSALVGAVNFRQGAR